MFIHLNCLTGFWMRLYSTAIARKSSLPSNFVVNTERVERNLSIVLQPKSNDWFLYQSNIYVRCVIVVCSCSTEKLFWKLRLFIGNYPWLILFRIFMQLQIFLHKRGPSQMFFSKLFEILKWVVFHNISRRLLRKNLY